MATPSKFPPFFGVLTLLMMFCSSMMCCPSQAFSQSTSELADAVERKNTDQIRTLIGQKCDVNAAQLDGTTALHWSVHLDDLETTRTLIAAGANVDAKNHYGVMPLSLACTNGNAAIVSLLLDSGADPNEKLPGGETILMTAARTGKLAPVQTLLKAGVDVNAREIKKQTAIMWAAAEGHASVVKRLIDAGADYKTPLKSGFTPLFFAVRDGHIDVVKLLLDRGIDVNETMPVDAKRGRGPSPGMGPLSLAVENGHFELAVFLLESGADPNDQRSGFAPLHRMVWVRKPDRGDGLDGSPPPEGSGNIDSLQFVKKLVEHGADVNLRLQRSAKGFGRLNKKQATAFLMACKTADLPLMKLLLELKANPTIPNADQTTPLLVAAGIATFAPGEEAGTEPEAIEAIRLLLELGAEINTVDNKGETAMHGAAYKGFPEVARFLDANGADINVWNQENRQGWTPLLIACGYRPGNFRPLAPTIAAIREIMIKRGVTPPDDPRPNRKAEKAQ